MKRGGFLSWLRGKEPPQDSVKAQSAEAENVQENPRPETVPAHVEPVRPPAKLRLPSGHALMRLWTLRSEAVGSVPAIRLSLDLPDAEEPAVQTRDLDRELLRLKQQLDTGALERLEMVLPGGEEEHMADADASVLVFVPQDQLSAWVMVYPPSGNGRELNREMLSAVLRAENISEGVDEALLNDLPNQRDCYFNLRMVARGIKPVDGKDGYVEELFPRKTEREYTINDHNQVDYTALNLVRNVDKGDVICRITPPTEGHPGKTVRGEPIPAKSGKKADIPKGRNTALSEDGLSLIATMSGHVQFTGRYFEIRTVLEISGDVDFSTGNLNHLGDIHIHGDVRSGFTVRAMGNVTVDGVVEDTSVEASGDLIVRGGVQGNGKAVLRSHQNIYAQYLESCSVYAKGELHSDCVISCDVYCDGLVEVTTGRGSIIGGHILAGGPVRAGSVGARSEIRTEITLGGHPCEDVERDEVLRELQSMERDWENTERQPDSPAKQKRMADLRLKTAISRMKLEKFKKSLEQDDEANEAEDSDMRLIAGTVYPGTILSIHGQNLLVRDEVRSCIATLRDGEIKFI